MFSKSSKSPNNASPASTATPGAKRTSAAKGGSFSIIAADVTIEGNIRADADLHLDGRIEGDIACASLVQGAGSVIIGRIEAASVRLSGQVEGGIVAGDLVIEATARLHGDILYDSLSIAPGAQVEGSLHRRGEDTGKSAELKLISNESSASA